MPELRIGLVGLGFGEHHARTLANLDGARLAAVADSVPERVARIAARYNVPGYSDAAAMIRAGGLDALSVCVSPAYREAILLEASAHRLPLFVEKPWAPTLEQGIRFARIVGDLPVMVGFSFRFHPVVRRLQDLIRGELGEVRIANGDYSFRFLPPAGSWLWAAENGNGLFNENSCHLFDTVLALMGRPRSVMAAGRSYSGSPSEDGAVVSVEFGSGAVAAMSIGGLGSAAYKDYPRLDVMTERGQARLVGRTHVWESLSWALRDEREIRSVTIPVEALGDTRYTNAFAHFIACLRDGRAPEATMEDGLRSVELAEAIYRSIREKRLVELPESPERPR